MIFVAAVLTSRQHVTGDACLPDMADAGEAGLLEKPDRRAEGKPHIASRHAVSSTSPPPGRAIVQRAFQRRPRHA
jgi:hypothetical protein